MSLLFDKNKKYIYNSTIKSVFDKFVHYPNNTFLSSAIQVKISPLDLIPMKK